MSRADFPGRRMEGPPPWPVRRPPYKPNRPRPPFAVVLYYSTPGVRKAMSFSDIEELISSIPSRSAFYRICSSGLAVGRLFYNIYADALDATLFLWSQRLDGAHLLTPLIEVDFNAPSYDKSEEEVLLKALFCSHIRELLCHRRVRFSEQKIEELSMKLDNGSVLRKKPTKPRVFNELREEKNRLLSERKQLRDQLREFRAAMGCLLAKLGEQLDHIHPDLHEETNCRDGQEEIFCLGDKLDWNQIHGLMMRECRRLEDGLPIYGCRREILSHIFSNQNVDQLASGTIVSNRVLIKILAKVVVLIGETGSGKSTQLAQFLADSGFAAQKAVVCTQPRKIAVNSLAQRVGEEANGCYPNNFVLSYPSYVPFQEFKSGIIFMTDHYLLQHFMNDTSWDGISCIIIDEAHERNLNTDLLLALIKKELLKRPQLQLIIMSATADATKFSDYFCGCSTYYIMGRNFPVAIKYVADVSASPYGSTNIKAPSGKCASYVLDVLKMVSYIHKTEEDGAILAFLTSQIEVEWACETFTDPTALVMPMHGKLSVEEQRKVFQDYPGKRKVIFCTNIAETSLTIKGVKYVVDSGMVKESRFEPSTGTNVLKVSTVSQSSANQRAGRAGRTEPGKCYRLYSESDFHSMKMHQEPEIRKVHLGIAVLRILALGIKNVDDFEFVDAPCPRAVEIAIQNLIHLGAITRKGEVFDITEMGQNLVKLGIEPRLGKIILDCFDCGLRKEGVVLAAVMANASSIFCRVGTEEDKHKADCLRVRFCHHDGDLFTLLSVYRTWEAERESSNWCWKNSINAKSMRRCKEAISELESCLRHELNIIIPSYWLWNPDKPNTYDKLLKKVILSSLSENVAMFSGRDQLGYEVAITGQCIELHPSSSLLAYGRKPDWVVFGEILSLSNDYLVCVTAVDLGDLLMIQPPLFDVYQLESRRMQMNVITGVSNNILRRFCGRLNQNLQRVVSHLQNVCSDNRISVDVDFVKNEVYIYASKKDMEEVSVFVKDAMGYETRLIKNECIEKCLFPGRSDSSSLALFGSGAEIKHLELESRFLSVEILHPNSLALDDKELLMMVENCGCRIANYHKYVGTGQDGVDGTKWGRITFLSPDMAEYAINKLNMLEFGGSFLKALSIRTADQKIIPFSAVRVKVCWPRKPSRGIALVTCAPGEAEYVIEDCFSLAIGGRYIDLQVSEKYQNCVFVRGIPKDVSEAELYDAFLSLTKRKIFNIRLCRTEVITDLPNSTFEEALIKEISPFMPKKHFSDNSFRVEIFRPAPQDPITRAMITFDGSLHLEAAKALEHIEGKVLPGCLSWQKIQCQHVFRSSLCFPSHIYAVIRKNLDSLLESFRCRKGVSYNLEKNDNGSYRIKISANATKTIADLRRPLEQLIRGKIISHPSLNPAVLQVVWSRDGMACIKSLEREMGIHILCDRRSLNIRVFGPPRQVSAAEHKLVSMLLDLHGNQQLEIHLHGRKLPPNLMKEVVHRFGTDLQGLKDNMPEVVLTLNTRRHILSVRGTKDQKQRVQDLITELALAIDQNGVSERSLESSCPICLCELEDPYKLEACGHTFCRSCLLDQCETTMRSRDGFPLCCIKEGCKELILLIDLKSLLSSEKLEELFKASLSAFVISSDGAYRFCPTPDCPGVYRVALPDDEVGPFVCGACTAETCRKCNLEYHPFISCDIYMEYKDDPDFSLAEWVKEKENVSNCPGCGWTIEKTDGCNHVECRCGRHICWVCLDYFKSSDQCYSHLRSIHQTY
ncbi:hypothetical protein ZIOFF_007560 [Zingiber officinale]|uniref:RNA helicase n=1 Tax=Zingiber officinale TaxID=94328 RepID=A0A8J5IDY3_ZINOF|nr:hypothetical protein ZIOFF_007560 [Zingiber officinale]